MIAYVLGKHLQPSQTFVTNEISELRRQGVALDVLSVEHGDVVLDDVTYLADLAPSRGQVLRAHLGTAVRRPLGYALFLVRVRAMRSEMGDRPTQVRWQHLPVVAQQPRRRSCWATGRPRCAGSTCPSSPSSCAGAA